MGEIGKIIAGRGSNKIFRDAALVVEQYGGKASDWVKKVSDTVYRAPDDVQIETHWVENINTGAREMFKTVMKYWEPTP